MRSRTVSLPGIETGSEGVDALERGGFRSCRSRRAAGEMLDAVSPFCISKYKSGNLGEQEMASQDELEEDSLLTTFACVEARDNNSPTSMAQIITEPADGSIQIMSPSQSTTNVEPCTPGQGRFKGVNRLQYGLWAHYMALGAAALCFSLGCFAYLWENPKPYDCQVRKQLIYSGYLFNSSSVCNNAVTLSSGEVRYICCDPAEDANSLRGNKYVGAVYVFYAVLLLFIENTSFGFGLWYPTDSVFYRLGISPCAVVNLLIGAGGFLTDATMLAGACLIILAFVQGYAARRGESGDGGRKTRAAAREKAAKDGQPWYHITTYTEYFRQVREDPYQWKPSVFFYNDKISTCICLFVYFGTNYVIFEYFACYWLDSIGAQETGLLNGSLDLSCDDCEMNRKALQYGPMTAFAAFAKACGACINYNCALLLLPVTKFLLRKISDTGNSKSANEDFLTRKLACLIARHLPLQRSLGFHKLVAMMIFFLGWAHMIMHYMNLIWRDATTLIMFTMFGWTGTAWLTGSIVSITMFFIYSAAAEEVRRAKFEIFFYSHHMFTVFYLIMFLHGPVFFYWTCIPALLYIYDRYLQLHRGKCPFMICKVEWIPPVMAVYFRPVFKVTIVMIMKIMKLYSSRFMTVVSCWYRSISISRKVNMCT
jgi:hypothetical protein